MSLHIDFCIYNCCSLTLWFYGIDKTASLIGNNVHQVSIMVQISLGVVLTVDFEYDYTIISINYQWPIAKRNLAQAV